MRKAAELALTNHVEWTPLQEGIAELKWLHHWNRTNDLLKEYGSQMREQRRSKRMRSIEEPGQQAATVAAAAPSSSYKSAPRVAASVQTWWDGLRNIEDQDFEQVRVPAAAREPPRVRFAGDNAAEMQVWHDALTEEDYAAAPRSTTDAAATWSRPARVRRTELHDDVDAAAASAGQACNVSDLINNDINYSSFSCDASSDASSAANHNIPTAFLSSSSTTDVLGLMHERTGHQNKRSLIECVKSRLVTGLKIENKHIRKYKQDDRHVCDICARSKLTRTIFKKFHTIRGHALGDYISVDIAVFVNCPSREGYKYVVCFTDHATKFSWVYPMKLRDEFIEKLRHLIDVELHSHRAKIKHYHADGGAELISKQVLALLKREGSRYTWNPADTPELNATSERKFRTLGERCLSMLLRAGLPVDFWWDAYETSNYLTVRLPTKTAHGYITPFEGVYGEGCRTYHICGSGGCKAYLKLPKNYQRLPDTSLDIQSRARWAIDCIYRI